MCYPESKSTQPVLVGIQRGKTEKYREKENRFLLKVLSQPHVHTEQRRLGDALRSRMVYK
jgi:hypothetical protein